MKKIVLFFGFLLLTTGLLIAQENKNEKKNGAQLTFEKTTHDFGVIPNGSDGTYEFVFKNTGKEPLIISNAKGSCGCTVPVWPKEPIAPKESNVIQVRYDTKRTGKFQKSITISSNAETSSTVIFIKGEVLPVSKEKTIPKKEPSLLTPTSKP